MGSIRSPDQVLGSLNKKPMYSVTISRSALARVKQLTASGAAPDWIEEPGDIMSAKLITTDPEWFVAIDQKIADSLRGR
jgi:hypothetical protein